MSNARTIAIDVSQERSFDTQAVVHELGFVVPAEVMADAAGSEAIRGAVVDTARRLAESVLFSWKPGDARVRITARFTCCDKSHEHVK